MKSIAGIRRSFITPSTQSFLNYFGSNGVAAVEQAFAVLNGMTNFSKYSVNLSEVPLDDEAD